MGGQCCLQGNCSEIGALLCGVFNGKRALSLESSGLLPLPGAAQIWGFEATLGSKGQITVMAVGRPGVIHPEVRAGSQADAEPGASVGGSAGPRTRRAV